MARVCYTYLHWWHNWSESCGLWHGRQLPRAGLDAGGPLPGGPVVPHGEAGDAELVVHGVEPVVVVGQDLG